MTLGQIIENRFKIVDEVGVGGMSTVYMGRDMKTSQTVAIKLMDENLTDDLDYLACFEREAQVSVSLRLQRQRGMAVHNGALKGALCPSYCV